MIVSTAIDLLKEADLKQLVVRDNKAAVRGFINLGVLELYKRFRLAEGEAVITQVAGVTEYKLDGIDTNVMIDLTDKQLIIAEIEEFGSKIRLPAYNKIKFDKVVPGEEVIIRYRYAPPSLMHEKEEIILPPQFIEALFHYVGYRGHMSVKGDVKQENNTHYQRFERSCDNVTYNGLYIQEELSSTKFEDRGFV